MLFRSHPAGNLCAALSRNPHVSMKATSGALPTMRYNTMTMRVAAAGLLAPSLLAGCRISYRQVVSPAAITFGEATSVKIRFSPMVEYPAREYESDGALQICTEGIQFAAHEGWWVPIPYSSIWFVEVSEGAFVGIDTLYVYCSRERWAFQIGKNHNVKAIADTIRKRTAPAERWTREPLTRYDNVRWESFGAGTNGHLAIHAQGIQFMAGSSLQVAIPYPAMQSVDSKEGTWRQDTLLVTAAARTFRFNLPRHSDVTALARDIRQRAGL